METRVKELSELPDFNRMELESHGMPRNWGFCRGGEHLEDNQWAIKHVHEDLSMDLYPLPLWVTPLIRWTENNAKREMQSDIRNVLGL